MHESALLRATTVDTLGRGLRNEARAAKTFNGEHGVRGIHSSHRISVAQYRRVEKLKLKTVELSLLVFLNARAAVPDAREFTRHDVLRTNVTNACQEDILLSNIF